VQVVRAAVSQMHFAMNDVGVGTGSGPVKRPLELAKGDGKTGQGDVTIGPRIAEAPGFLGEMSRHLREQGRFLKLKALAQLKFHLAVLCTGESEMKDGCGLPLEISTLRGGDQLEAAFGSNRVHGAHKISF